MCILRSTYFLSLWSNEKECCSLHSTNWCMHMLLFAGIVVVWNWVTETSLVLSVHHSCCCFFGPGWRGDSSLWQGKCWCPHLPRLLWHHASWGMPPQSLAGTWQGICCKLSDATWKCKLQKWHNRLRSVCSIENMLWSLCKDCLSHNSWILPDVESRANLLVTLFLCKLYLHVGP